MENVITLGKLMFFLNSDNKRNDLTRPVMGTIVLVGQAKQAPHWGVQSRFRVIYIYMSV